MNQPYTRGLEIRNPDQDVFFMRQALALAEGQLQVYATFDAVVDATFDQPELYCCAPHCPVARTR